MTKTTLLLAIALASFSTSALAGGSGTQTPGTSCLEDVDGDNAPSGYWVDSADDDCTDAGEMADLGQEIDCNDNDATVYPGAPELNDGVDGDCDGVVDNHIYVGCGAADGDAIVIKKTGAGYFSRVNSYNSVIDLDGGYSKAQWFVIDRVSGSGAGADFKLRKYESLSLGLWSWWDFEGEQISWEQDSMTCGSNPFDCGNEWDFIDIGNGQCALRHTDGGDVFELDTNIFGDELGMEVDGSASSIDYDEKLEIIVVESDVAGL